MQWQDDGAANPRKRISPVCSRGSAGHDDVLRLRRRV